MLRWLHRRRKRLKRIEAEADTLIQHFGVEASSAEARRQEREANDLAMAWCWNAPSATNAKYPPARCY